MNEIVSKGHYAYYKIPLALIKAQKMTDKYPVMYLCRDHKRDITGSGGK